MKILIICSATKGFIAPFIAEQAESLRLSGLTVDFFHIGRKGLLGYLAARTGLRRKIRAFAPDIIHAHYGLSGLLSGLQRDIPVVTTFHGSDVNEPRVRPLSKLAYRLSAHSVFVSTRLKNRLKAKKHCSVIPCGVDLHFFEEKEKHICREQLGWEQTGIYILFAGSADNNVKNYPLAAAAVNRIAGARLIPLAGYTRAQVVLLLNAADVALMTSFTEGSPQFVKEAMACGCPVVSTDVGDVAEITSGVEGCFICDFDTGDVEQKVQFAINFAQHYKKTNGSLKLKQLGLSLTDVAERLIGVYTNCLNGNA
jgi:glycosyltransferase involved in cell wall biosynthesis